MQCFTPTKSLDCNGPYVIDDVRSLTAFFSFALPCLPYLSLAHLFQFVSAEKLEGAAAADAAAVAAAAPAEAAPADAAPVLAGGDAAAAAAAVADVAQTVQVPFDGNQPAAIENAIAAAVAAGRTPLIVRRLSHFKATLAHTRTHPTCTAIGDYVHVASIPAEEHTASTLVSHYWTSCLMPSPYSPQPLPPSAFPAHRFPPRRPGRQQ